MMTNLELYGTNDVPNVPKEIANERLRLLKKHLATVMSGDEWDTNIVNRILKAQLYWTKLRDGEEL